MKEIWLVIPDGKLSYSDTTDTKLVQYLHSNTYITTCGETASACMLMGADVVKHRFTLFSKHCLLKYPNVHEQHTPHPYMRDGNDNMKRYITNDVLAVLAIKNDFYESGDVLVVNDITNYIADHVL